MSLPRIKWLLMFELRCFIEKIVNNGKRKLPAIDEGQSDEQGADEAFARRNRIAYRSSVQCPRHFPGGSPISLRQDLSSRVRRGLEAKSGRYNRFQHNAIGGHLSIAHASQDSSNPWQATRVPPNQISTHGVRPAFIAGEMLV